MFHRQKESILSVNPITDRKVMLKFGPEEEYPDDKVKYMV